MGYSSLLFFSKTVSLRPSLPDSENRFCISCLKKSFGYNQKNEIFSNIVRATVSVKNRVVDTFFLAFAGESASIAPRKRYSFILRYFLKNAIALDGSL